MAKQSYLGANVVTTDSFAGWIDKTNQVRDDMGNIVVTVTTVVGAEPNTTNAGLTTGNAAIAGVLTANTIAVSQYLRGGTVTTNTNLTITSNALFTTTGNVDITAANVVNIDANNTVISSNVTFDGGVTKTIRIDVANTTVNSGTFYVNSNAIFSSNVTMSGTNTTIGDAGTDVLNIVATSVHSSNSSFTGALVNITSTNTTIGDAGTDVLNVNAVSDFNANVNVDGILTVTANAIFSGANVNINGNTSIGDAATDRLIVNSTLSSDLIPLDNTIDLGTSANNYGNVFATYVYSANNIQTSNELILNGTGARTIRTIDTGALATPAGFTFIAANNTTSNTVLIANTSGLFSSANVTYDLGSVATSWRSLFVKDATVANTVTINAQANTASLMVRNLTATRVAYIGTAGQIVDSANLTFSGTALNVIGTANVTSNANVGGTFGVTGATTLSSTLGVTGAITASNTLGVTGATTLSSTLGVTGAITASNTLAVTGDTSLSANLSLLDNKYVRVGTGLDLLLYHDATNSFIKNNTGTLSIDAANLAIVTSNSTATETMAVYTRDAGVSLYYDNSKKFETTTTGVTVTGATIISGNLTVQGTTNLATDTNFTVNTSISNISTVYSLLTSSGNTVLGDASTDVVQFIATANSNFIPSSNVTYNLGSTTNNWSNVYSNNIVSVTTNANTVNANTVDYQYAATTTATATTAAITQTAIASFSATTYGAAEVIITAKQGVNRHITKLLLTHNGTTAISTEYGTILTSTSLASFDVDITTGNVRILATPASISSTTFNVVLTLINA